MLFAFICKDKPGHLNVRMETRPAHLEHLNKLNAEGTLKIAGPFLDAEGKPNGSLVIVDAADIDAAARVLAPYAVRTPLLSSPAIDAATGARMLFKPEVLQRTGSFKFRGAFNKMAAIPDAARAGGVVAFSSGNHAQGVAAAAAMFGARAVIAMPADAPRTKTDNVRRMGAEIIPFDRFSQDRAAVVQPWLDEGMALVPPFDDAFVIASA